MRFYHHHKPMADQLRLRKFFAVLPITIGCETRWLETVIIEESFRPGDPPWSGDTWRPKRFIDTLPTPE